MDPQLEEIVKQIGDAVEKRVSRRFEAFEGRIEDGVGEFELRVGTRLDEFEQRVTARAKADTEELRTVIKLFAERNIAALEKIERELVALNTKMDTKFADHAKRQHAVETNAPKRKQASRRTSRR